MSGKKTPQPFRVQIIDKQERLVIDRPRIRATLAKLAADEKIQTGRFEVVIVDDPTIHELNLRFLEHDYPTDVLSFEIEVNWKKHLIEGSIIVSADTAIRQSAEYDNSPDRELLLYIIHGALHLFGYDDHNPSEEPQMRAKEEFYLNYAMNTPLPNVDSEP